ncbi:MAG: hypothetical protein WBB29_19660 [Geitlerinemataceae cyanobacterium]
MGKIGVGFFPSGGGEDAKMKTALWSADVLEVYSVTIESDSGGNLVYFGRERRSQRLQVNLYNKKVKRQTIDDSTSVMGNKNSSAVRCLRLTTT